MTGTYAELAARWSECEWLRQVCEQAATCLELHNHGDLPRWREALRCLPPVVPTANLKKSPPQLGEVVADTDLLRRQLMELHPWRKGPLRLGGLIIDAEWRSDWKWARVRSHLSLQGARVLDIGCGNGYFGLRMLDAGAQLVVGIDPTLLFTMQWFACRHFSGPLPNYVLPLAVEDLPAGPVRFDCVSSMGVLYHRRDPVRHLQRMHRWLRTGGTLLLETLVLPPALETEVLIPDGRYARMRNVWAVPGAVRLLQWIGDAGFVEAKIVDVTATTVEEQRSTPWMRFDSLERALDPEDRARTVEGHPAPVRAVVVARCGAG